MFTGIIEKIGEVTKIQSYKNGKIIRIAGNFTSPVANGESIAINGICLTVTKKDNDYFETFASGNTITKTNLAKLRQGQIVNLERALKLTDRIGGHLVQGHIDTVAKIIGKITRGDSITLSIACPPEITKYIIQNGSIAINGVSLTVAKKLSRHFEVVIIPYTLSNTNLNKLKIGDLVNIETDIIGKYLNGR